MNQPKQWTPPRVYTRPDGSPYRVTIYEYEPPTGPTHEVCSRRDPTAADLANFDMIAKEHGYIEREHCRNFDLRKAATSAANRLNKVMASHRSNGRGARLTAGEADDILSAARWLSDALAAWKQEQP